MTSDLLEPDFAILCMDLMPLLGPTPVMAACYADSIGKPHYKVDYALQYLVCIGKAKLDFTTTGGRCYGKM